MYTKQHVLAGISQIVVTIGWGNIIPTDLWLWSAMYLSYRSFTPKTNALFSVDTRTRPPGFFLKCVSNVWVVQALHSSLCIWGFALALIRVLRVCSRQGICSAGNLPVWSSLCGQDQKLVRAVTGIRPRSDLTELFTFQHRPVGDARAPVHICLVALASWQGFPAFLLQNILPALFPL